MWQASIAHPSTREVKADILVQSYPQIYHKFEASLDFIRLSPKSRQNKTNSTHTKIFVVSGVLNNDIINHFELRQKYLLKVHMFLLKIKYICIYLVYIYTHICIPNWTKLLKVKLACFTPILRKRKCNSYFQHSFSFSIVESEVTVDV